MDGKKMYQANGKHKKAGVAMLISGKIEFKMSITIDEEGDIHNDKRISSSENTYQS